MPDSPRLHRTKKSLRKVVQGVAIIAGIVFFVTNPVSNRGTVWFFCSIPVLLLCFLAYMLLGEELHLEPPPTDSDTKRKE